MYAAIHKYKMEKIFKYKANDGAEFNFKDACLKYEAEAEEIQLIMSELPEKPDNCGFGNGGGYIQHDKETFISVRTKLLEIAKRLKALPNFDAEVFYEISGIKI
jgi:hypothetical protein